MATLDCALHFLTLQFVRDRRFPRSLASDPAGEVGIVHVALLTVPIVRTAALEMTQAIPAMTAVLARK